MSTLKSWAYMTEWGQWIRHTVEISCLLRAQNQQCTPALVLKYIHIVIKFCTLEEVYIRRKTINYVNYIVDISYIITLISLDFTLHWHQCWCTGFTSLRVRCSDTSAPQIFPSSMRKIGRLFPLLLCFPLAGWKLLMPVTSVKLSGWKQRDLRVVLLPC